MSEHWLHRRGLALVCSFHNSDLLHLHHISFTECNGAGLWSIQFPLKPVDLLHESLILFYEHKAMPGMLVALLLEKGIL